MKLFLAFYLALFAGVCVGALVGRNDAKRQIRDQAIEAGVAEYRVNPKTGETSFHFITREEKK